MKIKEIRTYFRDLGTTRPYTIAYKTVDHVINAFVEIELENGMVGIGSSNPSPKVVNESVDQSIKTLAEMDFSYLQGRRISEFESHLRQTAELFAEKPGSCAAVDIALHDAYTQFLGIPLVSYFGQKHKSLPTSVTIGIKNVADSVEEASEYYGMGYRILKVKTGLNPTEDAERVVKIQEKHDDMIIRVDANQGYTAGDLMEFIRKSTDVYLEFIEQPFPVNCFVEDINKLDEDIMKIVVADESLRNPADALHLIRKAPGCKILNIKVMKSGGLLGARQIAAMAGLSGVKLMWGCNDESAVSIAAALHVALAQPHTKYLDLDGSLDLIKDVVSGGFAIKDGYMSLTDKPGLGLTLL